MRTIKNVPVRFLSVEPLLEDIGEIDLTDIHWVIVGGESGAKARIIQNLGWKTLKRNAKNQTQRSFLSSGGMGKRWHKKKQKANGRLLKTKFGT